jgi:hypothetical protein
MAELEAALAAWRPPPRAVPEGVKSEAPPPPPPRRLRLETGLLAVVAMAGIMSLTLIGVGQAGALSPILRWLVALMVGGAAGAGAPRRPPRAAATRRTSRPPCGSPSTGCSAAAAIRTPS